MTKATTPLIRDIKWLQKSIQEKQNRFVGFSNRTKLFESDSAYLIAHENIEEKYRNRMLASIDRAGVRVPYRCELYPSAQSHLSKKQRQLGVMYNDIDRSFENFPSFRDWFIEWVDNRIVAPDTGILLNHYLSEVLLPRISPITIRIRIPRFSVLEIEARGTRSGNSKEDARNYTRLSLSAFDEVRRLRLEADAIPFSSPIKADLMRSFSQISGQRNVDAFIRLEIWDQMYGRNTIPEWTEHIVLLTRDMMMACAASAEDIDAFYFSPAKPEKTEFEVNPQILTKIILETAVTFGEIRIEGLFKDRSMICEGMWSGKTLLDWYNRRIRVYFRAS